MCPGFEAVFAIAGLMAIAYLVLRRIPKRPYIMPVLLVAIMLTSVFVTMAAAAGTVAVVTGFEASMGIVVPMITGIAVIVALVIRRTKRTNHKISSRHSVSHFSHIGIARTALIYIFICNIYTAPHETHWPHWYFDRAA